MNEQDKEKVEPYDVQVYRAGRKIYGFKTHCAAILGQDNGATLCTSGDVAIRIILASRVRLYLKTLIDTIIDDSSGMLSESDVEELIEELNANTDLSVRFKDPETVQELLKRLKGGR